MANDRNQHAESLDPLVMLRQRNMTIVNKDENARVLLMEGASLTDEEMKHSTMYLLGVIGKGGQAVVLKAWDNDEKKQVCIKMAKYEGDDGNTVARSNEAFCREAEFYRMLDSHRNIASMLFSGGDGGAEGSPCLILERCYGSPLAKLIGHYEGKNRRVPFNVRRKIMKDAASAVQHCFFRGIAHSDLTPSNFVWFPSMEQPVKLIDFGFAVNLAKDSHFRGGTPGYKAPEHILEEHPHEKSDVFGLGCLFHKLHNVSLLPWDKNRKPRSWEDFGTMYKRALQDNFQKAYKKNRISEQDRLLLMNMLKIRPEARPGWEEVQKGIEVLRTVAGEKQLDLSESAEKVMRLSSYEPRPARAIQAESMPTTANQQEADDEGTGSEENPNDEENSFTREHYPNTLAAVERIDQRQRRIISESLQNLENSTRFDSTQTETINRVEKKINEKIKEAERSMEAAGGEDDIKKVAKKIGAVVADIGEKEKSDIDRHAKEETDALKEAVSVLVEKAREKIFDMAFSSARPKV